MKNAMILLTVSLITIGIGASIMWGIFWLAENMVAEETIAQRNARVVAQTKYCTENGLDAWLVISGENVICSPKTK